MLRLDRLRSLVDVYPGVEREDEMVAAFDFCLHGKGGAAPSIDTAMHGLVDAAARRPPAPRLRHRAGDGGRRGEADRGVLRRPGRLGAVAAPGLPAGPGHRRDQGGQPAGDRLHPRRARHHRLGRHLRGGRGELAGDHPHGGGVPRRARHRRAVRPGRARLRAAAGGRAPREGRRARSRRSAGSPRTDQPQVGHFTDNDVVLEFLSARAARAAGRAGHLLPGPLPAHQGQAAGRRPARRRAPVEEIVARLQELHEAYRADYQAYYDRHATPDSPADARRGPGDRAGARRGHVLLRQGQADRPGRGRVLRQRDQRDARRRVGVDLRADRARREKFRIEYWALEEAKLARMPKPKPLATRIALVTGAGSGIGKAIATGCAAEGACVVIADLNLRQRPAGGRRARRRRTWRSGSRVDVTDEAAVAPALAARRAGLRRGGPGGQQRRAVAVQAAAGDHRRRLGPAARRHGQGLVPGLPRGGAGDDRPGAGRRHRLHLVEELGVRRPEQHRLLRGQGRPGPPGPAAGRRARRARHPGQRHQPRRRRARLGDLRRRLGRQARRGLRGQGRRPRAPTTPSAPCSASEVLPEHVADAVSP